MARRICGSWTVATQVHSQNHTIARKRTGGLQRGSHVVCQTFGSFQITLISSGSCSRKIHGLCGRGGPIETLNLNVDQLLYIVLD